VSDIYVGLLRARERSKRFLVIGVVGLLYAAAWLFIAWRASRVAETDCTVSYVKEAAACTLQHTTGGAAHTLPYEDCGLPTRWPYQPIGSTLRCHYYLNAPSDIFLEPRDHRWLTPMPVLVLGLALACLAYGAVVRPGAKGRPVPGAGAPYRIASRATDDVPRLFVPLSQSHWSRWIVGGPLFVMGLVLSALVGLLLWTSGGALEPFELFLVALSHAVTLWGALTLFYRSGLVLERELCVYWWGLGAPWFQSFRSLEALNRTESKREGAGRATSYWLVLHFGDGAPWKFRRASHGEAEAEAQRIAGYLDSVRRKP
jgi:hypothetical protein